ncbi:MAG: hypothetical protein ACFBSE_17880 [Prochloraceae cyanobacterium]
MFFKFRLKRLTFLSLLFLLSTQPLKIDRSVASSSLAIPADTAISHTSDIFITPGRITVISFEDGEKIVAIATSDNHRFTYTTNLSIESGKATHLIISQINKIPHPDATTNSIPNLVVFTTNADGTFEAAYEFNLHLNSTFNRGVRIVDTPIEQKLTWNTKFGHAHPKDIQNGFEIAERQGKITADDAHKIRTFLAKIRNGETIDSAIEATQISVELIDILAEIGLKHFHRRLSSGHENSHHIRCVGTSCNRTNDSPALGD